MQWPGRCDVHPISPFHIPRRRWDKGCPQAPRFHPWESLGDERLTTRAGQLHGNGAGGEGLEAVTLRVCGVLPDGEDMRVWRLARRLVVHINANDAAEKVVIDALAVVVLVRVSRGASRLVAQRHVEVPVRTEQDVAGIV